MSHQYKGFVSEIDQFLQSFDKQHRGLSESQKKEIAKYKQIYQLRDTPNRPNLTPVTDDWF